MLKRLLFTLDRRFVWKRSSHEAAAEQQAVTLKVGDIVECAVENPGGIRYRIETIDHSAQTATITMLGQTERGETPVYTLSPVMLRLLPGIDRR